MLAVGRTSSKHLPLHPLPGGGHSSKPEHPFAGEIWSPAGGGFRGWTNHTIKVEGHQASPCTPSLEGDIPPLGRQHRPLTRLPYQYVGHSSPL